MIDWTVLINFSMGVAGVALSSLGLILSIACRPLERRTRIYFIVNFSILIVYTLALSVSNFAVLSPASVPLKASVFMESLSSSLLMPLLTFYMLRTCGENLPKNALFLTISSLWLGYFALLLFTQFTTVIYYIDSEGIYHRGPLYPLLLVSPAAIMLLNLIGLGRRWKKLTRRQRHALLICMSAPLAGMILQMFFYGLLLVAFGTIAGALAMFVFVLTEQVDLTIRQAMDNAEKEFNLKVLQMRPHFIYNVMTSIYYLIDTDPRTAKESIRGFSKYLHQNFNAVVKTGLVPFEEELEHTRAYLVVEQARFGNRLEVTFDIPHTDFLLPPLTLEPIVENAVKHGMDPDCDPLRILIRTRPVDGGSEIVVENNGTSFDPAASDNVGVGLSNVRERLALTCQGTLRITQRKDGGAIVTLRIPAVKQ